ERCHGVAGDRAAAVRGRGPAHLRGAGTRGRGHTGRGGGRGCRPGGEHDVDPVVLGVEGEVGEAAGGAVPVDPVAAAHAVLERVQRHVVDPGGAEVAAVARVVPGGREVGG